MKMVAVSFVVAVMILSVAENTASANEQADALMMQVMMVNMELATKKMETTSHWNKAIVERVAATLARPACADPVHLASGDLSVARGDVYFLAGDLQRSGGNTAMVIGDSHRDQGVAFYNAGDYGLAVDKLSTALDDYGICELLFDSAISDLTSASAEFVGATGVYLVGASTP